MERFYEIIDLCDSVDRKDLSEFLQELVESIKHILIEVGEDDSDYEGSVAAESSEEEIEEGEPPNSHKKIEEEDYKVHIDEDGFWSFVFSDDED